MEEAENNERFSPLRVRNRPILLRNVPRTPIAINAPANTQSDTESDTEDDRVVPLPAESNDSSEQSSLRGSPPTSPRTSANAPEFRAVAVRAWNDRVYLQQFFRDNPNLLVEQIKEWMEDRSQSTTARFSPSRRSEGVVQIPGREVIKEEYVKVVQESELLARERANLESERRELQVANDQLQQDLNIAQNGYDIVLPEKERLESEVNEQGKRLADLTKETSDQKRELDFVTSALATETAKHRAATRVNSQLSESILEIRETIGTHREAALQAQVYALADNVDSLERERRENALKMAVREEEVGVLRGELDKSRSWQEMMRTQILQHEAELWERDQQEQDLSAPGPELERKKSLGDELEEVGEDLDRDQETRAVIETRDMATQTDNKLVAALLEEGGNDLRAVIEGLRKELEDERTSTEMVNAGTQTDPGSSVASDIQTEEHPSPQMVNAQVQTGPASNIASANEQIKRRGIDEDRMRQVAANAQRRMEARRAALQSELTEAPQPEAEEPKVPVSPDSGIRIIPTIPPYSPSEEILQSLSQAEYQAPPEGIASSSSPQTPRGSGGDLADDEETSNHSKRTSPTNSDKSWVAVDESGRQFPSPPRTPPRTSPTPQSPEWDELSSPKDTRLSEAMTSDEQTLGQPTGVDRPSPPSEQTPTSPRPKSGTSSSSKSSSSSSEPGPDETKSIASGDGGSSYGSDGDSDAAGADTAVGEATSSNQPEPSQSVNQGTQTSSGSEHNNNSSEGTHGGNGDGQTSSFSAKNSHTLSGGNTASSLISSPASSSSNSPRPGTQSGATNLADSGYESTLFKRPQSLETKSIGTQTATPAARQSLLKILLRPFERLIGFSSIDERYVMNGFSVSRRSRRDSQGQTKTVKWTLWSLFYAVWLVILAFLLYQAHRERQLWQESNASKKLEILSWRDDHWSSDLMTKMNYRVVKMSNLDRSALG